MSNENTTSVEDKESIAASNEQLRYSIESKGGRYCLFTMNTFMDELIKETARKLELDEAGTELLYTHFGVAWSRMNAIVGSTFDYMELFQHHVVDHKRLTAPVLFKMNDLAAKITQAATFVNRDITTRRPLHGHDDKRWKQEPLPYERLVKDKNKIGTVRIPMKADTGIEILYGYYELFIDRTPTADGQPSEVVTTIPAFRTKDKYTIPNAIYRWFIVDEAQIKDIWARNRDCVPHPIPTEETEYGDNSDGI